MEIKVIRKDYTKKSTIGDMYVDGAWLCYTLEDMVSPLGVKIKGMTAIPKGKYKVIVDMSNRFKREMPHILNVTGFDGVRIHKGNTDKDTEGCILVGMKKGEDMIYECSSPFTLLFSKLKEAKEATIEIVEC